MIQPSHISRSTGTLDTLSTSTPPYTTLYDLDDPISEDTTPSHELHLQDDYSVEIDLTLESIDHGEHSEPINISLHQSFC